MREKLAPIAYQKRRFSGVFECYGEKTTPTGEIKKTILLKQIKDPHGNLLCDHVWLDYTKKLKKIGELELGQVIEFTARVKRYIKGYVSTVFGIDNRTFDYRLTNPSRIKKIKSACSFTFLEHF